MSLKPKHKRLIFIIIGFSIFCAGVAIITNVLSKNITYFRTPSEIKELNSQQLSKRLRVGGMVMEKSVKNPEGVTYQFTITDGESELEAEYHGILPDLFAEGKGVVVEGFLNGTILKADKVLAKHDENYMPPEIAKQMKRE